MSGGTEAHADRGRRPPVRWLALCLIAGLWVLECDLSARDPNPPTGDGELCLVGLSDPDSTIAQIEIGLANRSITCYLNAFADDFEFHPDDQDSIDLSVENPGVFDNWTRDIERTVMQLVFAGSSIDSVRFTDVDSSGESPDVILFRKDYELQIDDARFDGTADLRLRRDSGGDWRIFFWKDFRRPGPPDSTWGFLRGDTRPGARIPRRRSSRYRLGGQVAHKGVEEPRF